MLKIEVNLTEELKQDLGEIQKLKTYGDNQPTEEEVVLAILELYTSRYKNMVKGSIKASENARKN